MHVCVYGHITCTVFFPRFIEWFSALAPKSYDSLSLVEMNTAIVCLVILVFLALIPGLLRQGLKLAVWWSTDNWNWSWTDDTRLTGAVPSHYIITKRRPPRNVEVKILLYLFIKIYIYNSFITNIILYICNADAWPPEKTIIKV